MSVPNILEVFKAKLEVLVEKEKKGSKKKKFLEMRKIFDDEEEKIVNFASRVLNDPNLNIEEEFGRFLDNDIKVETN